jgi:hypothetical protein
MRKAGSVPPELITSFLRGQKSSMNTDKSSASKDDRAAHETWVRMVVRDEFENCIKSGRLHLGILLRPSKEKTRKGVTLRPEA